MRYIIVFLAIWIAGCAVADYIFELDANSLRMLWGHVVGTFGVWLGNKAAN